MRSLIVLSLLCASAPLAAQGTATIDSGMTRQQVVAALGQPISTRSYAGHTYLLYRNGCEKTCGMSDLVVLDSDKVVDAIFRSPARHYSGTSSSPRMFTQAEARRGINAGAPLAVPAPNKPEPAAKNAEPTAKKPEPTAKKPAPTPAKPAPKKPPATDHR